MSDLISLKTHRQDNVALADDLQPLLAANIAGLTEGRGVLDGLSDEQYVASCKPAFNSTLGAHFRHLIEHYLCFLLYDGAAEEGALHRQNAATICYDSRQRDHKIEQDRAYALSVLGRVIDQLCRYPTASFTQNIVTVRDQDGLAPTKSTIARELLFLQSHTVHHHAMIAAMCRILQQEIPENFGVAIATQAFQAAQQACAQAETSDTETDGGPNEGSDTTVAEI